MRKIYLLLIISCFTTINAQEIIKKDSINAIIINYQAVKLTPVSFKNIDKKSIQIKSIGQEPSFLLSETPSITNYSDSGGPQGYSYFRIRGIDQTRINITLDGVPLNEPEDQGAYFSNYPDILNSANKIQIQRGVGTSKNGVASFGGSIQLFSPNLTDSTSTNIGFNYGSYNTTRVFANYNSGLKNNKSLYISASKVYSDGYKENASNNAQSVFLSSAFFSKKSIWKINGILGQQKNQLAWLGVEESLIEKNRKTNANVNEKDDFTQFLFQVQNNYNLNQNSIVQSSVYYTYLKGNYDFNLNGFLGLPITEELYNYAFKSNLYGFYSNYNFSKNNFNLTFGIHGNTYKRNHLGSEKTLGKLYDNYGNKTEISSFLKLNYTTNQFTFFTDLQVRKTNFEYVGSVQLPKINWTFFNPIAGISYKFKPNFLLYYSIGKTSREPTRNDIFNGNDDLLSDTNGNAIIANKEPEYVIDNELGVRLNNEKLNFEANFYYMNFKNEIVLDGKFGPNGLALTNKVEKSFRTGLEISINYKLNNKFTLINNSSFSNNRIIEQNQNFSPILTPPIIINQELEYKKNNILIAINARFQDKSFIDFANSSSVNAYTIFNARVNYEIKKIQFGFYLNNITNVKYFNNGYVEADGSKKYFVQMPINFNVSVIYKL